MRRFLLVISLALSFAAAGCGSIGCGEACDRAAQCGAIPGELGSDLRSCEASCAQSPPRTQEALRACLAASPCSYIRDGRCGVW